MEIFIGILMVVEVLVCLLLILIVLMQRPRQEGLGASFGGDMMSQIAGAQTTNVLQKFTVYLAIVLFVLTLSISMLTARQQSAKMNSQIFDAPPPPAPVESSKEQELKPPAASDSESKADEAKPASIKTEVPSAKTETSEATPAPSASTNAEEKPGAAEAKSEAAKPTVPAMKEPGEPAAEKSAAPPAAPKSDS